LFTPAWGNAFKIEWIRVGLSTFYVVDVRYEGADWSNLKAITSLVEGAICDAIKPRFVRTELIERQIQDCAATPGVTVEEAVDALL
jgi:hypothetical protein